MKRIFIAIIFTVVLLAGCGGGGGGGSDTGNPASGSSGSGTLGDATPTAKGTPTGAATVQTIGPSGGAVSNDSITLTIPAGALSANTLISITPITNTAHSGAGPSCDLSPEGLTFSKPIEVKMQLSDQDIGQKSIEAFNIAYQDSAGYWFGAADPITDPAAKTVTILTDHFTPYAPYEKYIIRPGGLTEVEVDKTQPFSVEACEIPLEELGVDRGFRNFSVLRDCISGPYYPMMRFLNYVESWKVDGILGGNLQRGSIYKTGTFTAEYKAPSSVPKPLGKEWVYITAVYRSYSKTIDMSADVKIVEKPGYTGKIEYTTEGPVNVTALISANFKLVPGISGGKYYQMEAEVKLTSDVTLNMAGQCKWVCKTPGMGNYVYNVPPPTGATALQIYDAPANTYDFKFLLNPPSPIMGDCVDYCSNPPRSLTMALPIFVGFGWTSDIGNYPVNDINLLQGSGTTSAGGDQKSTATWTIEKSKGK